MYGIAVSMVFLLLDVDINFGRHTLALLPAFVGYWRLAFGCRKFEEMYEPLAALATPARVMAALSGVGFLLRLFGVGTSLPWAGLFTCASVLIRAVFLWRVTAAIQGLKETYRLDLPAETLTRRSRWYIAFTLVAPTLGFLAAARGSGALLVFLWLVTAVVGICFCVGFFRCVARYRDCVPPKWRDTAE